MFSTAKDTNNTNSNLNEAKDTMANEGGRALHELKDGVRRTRTDARQAASSLRDDLEDTARKTGQHVRELADQATHGFSDATGALSVKIRENPLQSSLIALGIGMVVGMLYRRS